MLQSTDALRFPEGRVGSGRGGRCWKSQGSSRVGSDQEVFRKRVGGVGSGRVIGVGNLTGRVGSGRVISVGNLTGRVGSGLVGSGQGFEISWVESGRVRRCWESHGSGRVRTFFQISQGRVGSGYPDPIRPARRDPTREKR